LDSAGNDDRRHLIKEDLSITPTSLFNRILNSLAEDENLLYRKLDSIDIVLMKPNRFFDNYWMVREYWEDSDRPPQNRAEKGQKLTRS
ncbi:MAG: hypothetical protein U9N86_01175, partial [Bacteroidota bacterium]|nr:hypothetical protein [Bacteroidota bacterium]